MATKKKIDSNKLKLGTKKEIKKTTPSAEKADAAVNNIHTSLPAAANEKQVRFTLDIPESKHKEMKMRVLHLDKGSLKDYILELVDADIKANPIK